MTTAAPPDQPAIDAPQPAPPRLRRSGTDRMLAGVSGGLAEYTGIDVVLWRVAFVALTLLGGSGLLLYAVLWVAIPAAPPAPGAVPNSLDRFAGRMNEAVRQALGPRG